MPCASMDFIQGRPPEENFAYQSNDYANQTVDVSDGEERWSKTLQLTQPGSRPVTLQSKRIWARPTGRPFLIGWLWQH